MARAGLGESWRCLFANDFDCRKAESYRANWGGDELHVGDIHALTPQQLPGCADLAWASFPDPLRLGTALTFGFSALAMFVTSVAYHWASNPALKVRLRTLDHSAACPGRPAWAAPQRGRRNDHSVP